MDCANLPYLGGCDEFTNTTFTRTNHQISKVFIRLPHMDNGKFPRRYDMHMCYCTVPGGAPGQTSIWVELTDFAMAKMENHPNQSQPNPGVLPHAAHCTRV